MKTQDKLLAEPEQYFEIFQRSPIGQKVLEELSAVFYDSDIHIPGDPYTTAFRAGEREVVRFILMKCTQAQLPPEEE